MNDFLQSIRNGNFSKDNGKSRYNNPRNRRSYEPNGNYARSGNDRKYRPRHQNDTSQMDETLITIKETLTAILSNQESGISLAERHTIAEERKADAFEFIARHIGELTGYKFVPGFTNGDLGSEPNDDSEAHYGKPNYPQTQDTMGDDSVDMTKDEILELILTMRNDGATYNEIANHLDMLSLPTFSGRGKWHAQTIHRLCQTS